MPKPKFLALGCLLIMVPACSSTGNHERAYFTKQGASYLVEMTGTRRLMAHDPISAIRGKTYEDTLTLELPRIVGEIDGSEIPVEPGKLSYHGSVVITKNKMKVDLYYNDDDKRPLPWNGSYTLVPRNAGGTLRDTELLSKSETRSVDFFTCVF